MTYPEKNSRLTMSSPAEYRIIVHGRLNESYSSRLGGLNITTPDDEQPEPVTVLIGRLQGQAALLGILNDLYEMHMPLVSVEVLSGD